MPPARVLGLLVVLLALGCRSAPEVYEPPQQEYSPPPPSQSSLCQKSRDVLGSIDKLMGFACSQVGTTSQELYAHLEQSMGQPETDETRTCGQDTGKALPCRVWSWVKVWGGCTPVAAGATYIMVFSHQGNDEVWQLGQCQRCTSAGCVNWPFRPD